MTDLTDAKAAYSAAVAAYVATVPGGQASREARAALATADYALTLAYVNVENTRLYGENERLRAEAAAMRAAWGDALAFIGTIAKERNKLRAALTDVGEHFNTQHVPEGIRMGLDMWQSYRNEQQGRIATALTRVKDGDA